MTSRPVPRLPLPAPRFAATLTGLPAVAEEPRGIPFGSSLGRPALRVHVIKLAGGGELERLEHDGFDVGREELQPYEHAELDRHIAWHRANGGAL